MAGFYLKSASECATSSASACLENSDIKTCSKCNTEGGYGFFLDTATGNTNCILKTVTNCAVSEDTYPFKCTTCVTGWYPNVDGNCVSASEIKFC